MEIRRWLSPEETLDDTYERRQADRLDGTCEWTDGLPAIHNWLDSSSSGSSSEDRAIWVSGKAGSGKSVLAVHLFDRLSEQLRRQNWSATDVSRCSGSSETIDCQHHSVVGNKAALYFPISKTSTSAATVRTLVHQLLLFQPTRSELHKAVTSYKDTASREGRDECTSKLGMKILTRLLQDFPLT